MDDLMGMNFNDADNAEIRSKLLNITALASKYCMTAEDAREADKKEFVNNILSILPQIYSSFLDLPADEADPAADASYYQEYVDEDFYESIRRNIGNLLGADDTFLETFEEDMKYSDTPIAASVSECLADIFQPLYNFLSIVKDSEGEQTPGAYRECRENFDAYWSQTLCNVMRALNAIRLSNDDN